MVTATTSNSRTLETYSYTDRVIIGDDEFQDTVFEILELPGSEITFFDQDKGQFIDKALFKELVREWKKEHHRGADVLEMVMHPAYQHIIGMGPSVIPFLLRELEQQPEHWFWALYAITGENPIPSESEGNISKMAEAWLEWGKQQGYQW